MRRRPLSASLSSDLCILPALLFIFASAIPANAAGPPVLLSVYRFRHARAPRDIVVTPDTPTNRTLLTAVWRGDPEWVRWAFERGADANATYRRASTEGSRGTDPMPLIALSDREDALSSDTQKAVAILREFVRHGLDLKGLEGRGVSILDVALALGDIPFAQELLERGADPNAPLPGGGNAVHAAMSQILWGNDAKILPVLRLALEHGADPNVFNSNGMTPLHDAALMGVPRTVALLLKHGADPNALTRDAKGPMPGLPGLSPLLLAVRNGNAETIRLLAAAKRELTPLEAAASGDLPWLRKHLAAGLSPNHRDAGTPLLSSAAASGNGDCVRLLLDRGADVNAADGHGRTALHDAALLGSAPVAALLLARGAHPNTPLYHYVEVGLPPSGAPGSVKTHREIGSVDTPLTLAVDQANADVVAVLLRHGADLTRQGNRDALARLMRNVGGPILHVKRRDFRLVPKGEAAEDARERIYDLLVPRIDLRRSGGPALTATVERGQWGYARDLIERGAPVNARDRAGQTVLMLTVTGIGFNRRQADPSQMAKDGLSPAEIRPLVAERRAADAHGIDFLRFLLLLRPDLNVLGPQEPAFGPDQRKATWTALSIARIYELADVERMLRRAGARH